MGIVINSCVIGMHGMCLYSYLLCMHTLSTLLRTKAWYLQSQINEKDQNSLIEQSIHRFL